MNWMTLLLGLVIGFALEWIVENLYFGRGGGDAETGGRAAGAGGGKTGGSGGGKTGDIGGGMVAASGRGGTAESGSGAKADSRGAAAVAPAAAATSGSAGAAMGLAAAPERRDDLKVINGIGPAFERRLNGAGIWTHETLASQEASALERIIAPEDWQKFDFGSWISQAGALLAGGTLDSMVDDLKVIKGIGPVFERKLNAAGVSTFLDLAGMTSEDIEAVIEPQDWQKFDYPDWIRQAMKLARS